MGVVRNSMVALLLLYKALNSQTISESWDVKSSFFRFIPMLKGNTKAELRYDLKTREFNGFADVNFKPIAKILYRFPLLKELSDLEIRISSDSSSYTEDVKEEEWSYDVRKEGDSLYVDYRKNKIDTSYVLGANWTDAGHAFVEMVDYINKNGSMIGKRFPYKIHSSGDTGDVYVEFVESGKKGYDFCGKIRTQSGKKLFGLVKSIDVYFKGKSIEHVCTDLYGVVKVQGFLEQRKQIPEEKDKDIGFVSNK